MAASAHMLAFLLFFVLLAATFFGAFMYILESGEWDATDRTWKRPDLVGSEPVESPFKSVPHGIYWAITTLTTTGYGDMYPVSLAGRVIAGVTMLFGLVLFGILMNIVGKTLMVLLFGEQISEEEATKESLIKSMLQIGLINGTQYDELSALSEMEFRDRLTKK